MREKCVLHITNSYGGTTVYSNLYSRLDSLGVEQKIFVPLNSRNHSRIGNQLIDFKIEKSKIFYSTSLKWYHRYFYRAKIRSIVSEIKNTGIDFSKVGLTHASTLCLDGAVAYKLWLKFKIPYIVAVRNTDVNSYYKYMIHERAFFHKILLNAKKIVFISPTYQNKFLSDLLPITISNKIKDKAISIPNGIDNIFMANRKSKAKLDDNIKLLYVGAIQKNKNIDSVIKAIDILREEGLQITYTIIGKGLNFRSGNTKYIDGIVEMKKSREWLSILDSQNKETLMTSFSQYDIFIMPSFQETFGLVYAEALSQGLPTIYSKGQGFDGFFPEGVIGYSVESNNIKDICHKIKLAIGNYKELTANIGELPLQHFEWDQIAFKYKRIYCNLIKG